MREKLRGVIQEVIQKLGFPEVDFSVEHPENFAHGDYATNVAMVVAKHVGKKPQDVAGGIISALQEKDIYGVQKIDIAGPGFINIYLKSEFFAESVQEILDKDEKFGTSRKLEGKKVMVEYTDPNPFKEFHIGHLMSNAIGESISLNSRVLTPFARVTKVTLAPMSHKQFGLCKRTMLLQIRLNHPCSGICMC
jgi:arginyl-tRNA synthetase